VAHIGRVRGVGKKTVERGANEPAMANQVFSGATESLGFSAEVSMALSRNSAFPHVAAHQQTERAPGQRLASAFSAPPLRPRHA
jgi:hypothetical protein